MNDNVAAVVTQYLDAGGSYKDLLEFVISVEPQILALPEVVTNTDLSLPVTTQPEVVSEATALLEQLQAKVENEAKAEFEAEKPALVAAMKADFRERFTEDYFDFKNTPPPDPITVADDHCPVCAEDGIDSPGTLVNQTAFIATYECVKGHDWELHSDVPIAGYTPFIKPELVPALENPPVVYTTEAGYATEPNTEPNDVTPAGTDEPPIPGHGYSASNVEAAPIPGVDTVPPPVVEDSPALIQPLENP